MSKLKIVSIEMEECPYCGSGNTTVLEEEVDWLCDEVIVHCSCKECDREFKDIFRIRFHCKAVGTYFEEEAVLDEEVEYED